MNTQEAQLRVLCLTMNPSVDLATETERVVPTHKLRCGDTLHDAGGGGINVARVLTRLGGECTSLCPTGGSAGHWLETRMREEGIPSVFLPIADETRVSFTVHEHSTGAEVRFVMPGPHLSGAERQGCLDHLQALPPLPDLDETRVSFPVHEHSTGAEFRFVMPGPRLSGGEWQACLDHLQALAPFPDLLVASGSPPPGGAGGVAGGGARAVGHLGALRVTREASWRADPLDIPVSSAVGAGDSFVGGEGGSPHHRPALPEGF